MGLYEQFPYTNIHELNLDWVINEIKRLRQDITDVSGIVIHYADPIQWSSFNTYEQYTMVLDNQYDAYLSMQDVPAGITINNQDYWLKVGDFYRLAQDWFWAIAYNQLLNQTAERTFYTGDLFVYNERLYEALATIPVGNVIYPTGPNKNADETSVADQLDALKALINSSVSTIVDSLEYQNGERYASTGLTYFNGIATNSGKALQIYVPVLKGLNIVNSATFISGIVSGRTASGGYIDSTNMNLSSSTYTIDSITLIPGAKQLRITVKRTDDTAFTSGGVALANNSTVCFTVGSSSSLVIEFAV